MSKTGNQLPLPFFPEIIWKKERCMASFFVRFWCSCDERDKVHIFDETSMGDMETDCVPWLKLRCCLVGKGRAYGLNSEGSWPTLIRSACKSCCTRNQETMPGIISLTVAPAAPYWNPPSFHLSPGPQLSFSHHSTPSSHCPSSKWTPLVINPFE